MNALTDYRRPAARVLRQAAGGAWRPLGGWHQDAPGAWALVFAARGGRVRSALRARVFRSGGAWVWEVVRFDLASRRVRRVENRSRAGAWWASAHAAMPWAEAAARGADPRLI